MSQRYTKRDAEGAYQRLMKAVGAREATSYGDIGGWHLDHNGVYGGYVVEEVMNEAGGITHPLGHERRTAREFCDAVSFALRVLEVKEGAQR